MKQSEPFLEKSSCLIYGIPVQMSYSGDEGFQNVLDQSGIDRTVYDVKAYLLGSILAPEMVPPSHLIRNILAQDTKDEVSFKTQEAGTAFMSQFMGLWNKMASFQSSKVAPKFFPIPDEFESVDELLDAMEMRAIELDVFLVGLTEGGFDPELLTEETQELFAVIVAGAMMLNDEVKKIEEHPSDENCAKGHAILHVIDKRWAEGFASFESELRDMRKNSLNRSEPQVSALRAEEKFQRNDPCPCGSGKKYKKCCLQ